MARYIGNLINGIKKEILKHINLTVQKGKTIALVGASGSGKSTLMNILGLLDRPSSGSFDFGNQDVSKLSENTLAETRNKKIGFIFQSYNLLARTTALRNVTLPLLYNHESTRTMQEGDEKARFILERVGLGDRVHHQPHELSGGQQQRVAIARALINDPVMVIADEPTGNLDSRSGEEIMNILHSLHGQGTTIIMVTHDPKIAAHTQRTIHLMDGLVAEITHNGKNHPESSGVGVQYEAV